MSEGNSRAHWAHTSAVLAMIANVNRDAKKRPRAYQPSDFDPHTADKSEKQDVIRIDDENKENIGLLKQAFAGMMQKPL